MGLNKEQLVKEQEAKLTEEELADEALDKVSGGNGEDWTLRLPSGKTIDPADGYTFPSAAYH